MIRNFLRRRGARALALVMFGAIGFASATPAFADWHNHGGGYYRHDHWHGGAGVYVGPGYGYAPPVVYGPGYYAPPPVVYSPGINVGIRLGR